MSTKNNDFHHPRYEKLIFPKMLTTLVTVFLYSHSAKVLRAMIVLALVPGRRFHNRTNGAPPHVKKGKSHSLAMQPKPSEYRRRWTRRKKDLAARRGNEAAFHRYLLGLRCAPAEAAYLGTHSGTTAQSFGRPPCETRHDADRLLLGLPTWLQSSGARSRACLEELGLSFSMVTPKALLDELKGFHEEALTKLRPWDIDETGTAEEEATVNSEIRVHPPVRASGEVHPSLKAVRGKETSPKTGERCKRPRRVSEGAGGYPAAPSGTGSSTDNSSRTRASTTKTAEIAGEKMQLQETVEAA